MERRLAVASFEQREHFGHFEETARPAVDKQQWNGRFDIADLMHKMHVDVTKPLNVDGRLELGNRVVDALFVCAPVEFGLPMFDETLNVRPKTRGSFLVTCR